jgi:hypothetical protein
MPLWSRQQAHLRHARHAHTRSLMSLSDVKMTHVQSSSGSCSSGEAVSMWAVCWSTRDGHPFTFCSATDCVSLGLNAKNRDFCHEAQRLAAGLRFDECSPLLMCRGMCRSSGRQAACYTNHMLIMTSLSCLRHCCGRSRYVAHLHLHC